MRAILRSTLLSFVAILIAGCGLSAQSTNSAQSGTYQVTIFSAPWCINCDHYIPAFASELKAQLGERAKYVNVTIRVTTADSQAKPPTPEVVADYQKAHADLATFKFEADPWRLKVYSQYFGKTLALPRVVVIPPGATSIENHQKYDGDVPAREVVAQLGAMIP